MTNNDAVMLYRAIRELDATPGARMKVRALQAMAMNQAALEPVVIGFERARAALAEEYGVEATKDGERPQAFVEAVETLLETEAEPVSLRKVKLSDLILDNSSLKIGTFRQLMRIIEDDSEV